MKTIQQRYYHIKGTPKAEDVGISSVHDNYIKADVYYSEGGYSYFTYKNTPRGYFMSVHKVGRGKDSCGYWESTALFANDGCKKMISEVNRQSKKREENALTYFEANIDNFLKAVFPDLELDLEV